MSMMLHTLEARLWSQAWIERTMPDMVAGLLAPDAELRDERFRYAEDLWQASIHAESHQDFEPGAWELRQRIYWLDWPAVQWLMRLLAHFHFRENHIVESIVLLLCDRMGHEDDRGDV